MSHVVQEKQIQITLKNRHGRLRLNSKMTVAYSKQVLDKIGNGRLCDRINERMT